jgi:hypothetical protein
MLLADAVKQMLESPFIFQAIGKLDAIVRQNGMNAVRYGSNQPTEKVARGVTSLIRMQLSESELGRAINGDKQI